MIGTERRLLRHWRERDVAPFFAMGQDAEVMRYLGPSMSEDDCRATVTRMNGMADATGDCFWAVERRGDGAFVGFCGIKPGAAGTPIAGQPEIGWRLVRDAWGQGLARAGGGDHRVGERALVGADGAAWHDPRDGRRLRSPGAGRGRSAAAAFNV